jgi:hypothetical protein
MLLPPIVYIAAVCHAGLEFRTGRLEPRLTLPLTRAALPWTDVAITRARKRCFVFDEKVAVRQPMYDYLSQLGVAELGLDQQLSATRSTAGRKSSQQDWLRQGENLYQNTLYHHAERCFLKGADPARALEAGARRLCAQAVTLPADTRAASWRRGAAAFLQSAALQRGPERDGLLCLGARAYYNAARCAEQVAQPQPSKRSFDDAAQVLSRGFAAPRWHDAVACLVKAGAVQPREPSAWRALLTLCQQLPEGLMAPRLLTKLHQLVGQAATADAATLVESIAALEDEFDAEAIEWAAQE